MMNTPIRKPYGFFTTFVFLDLKMQYKTTVGDSCEMLSDFIAIYIDEALILNKLLFSH